MTVPIPSVTAEKIATYQRDGVVRLRGALNERRIAEIYLPLTFSLNKLRLRLFDRAPIR